MAKKKQNRGVRRWLFKRFQKNFRQGRLLSYSSGSKVCPLIRDSSLHPPSITLSILEKQEFGLAENGQRKKGADRVASKVAPRHTDRNCGQRSHDKQQKHPFTT